MRILHLNSTSQANSIKDGQGKLVRGRGKRGSFRARESASGNSCLVNYSCEVNLSLPNHSPQIKHINLSFGYLIVILTRTQSCNNHTQDMVQRQCSCKKFIFNNYCFPQKEFSHKKKRKNQTKNDHNKAKPPNLLQTLFCSLMNMGVTEYMAVTLIALTVQLNPSLMPMFC